MINIIKFSIICSVVVKYILIYGEKFWEKNGIFLRSNHVKITGKPST